MCQHGRHTPRCPCARSTGVSCRPDTFAILASSVAGDGSGIMRVARNTIHIPRDPSALLTESTD